MKGWAPRSLFGRLIIVLMSGVVLAQVAGLAIYWRDRDELMQRAFGMRSVQRIADIIRVLDDLSPGERSRIIRILNSPQLRIADDVALLARDEASDDARLFSSVLRRSLGDDRTVSVRIVDAPFIKGPPPGVMPGPGMMMGAGVGAGPGAGGFPFAAVSFVVQTSLHDGTLVTLDSRQDKDSLTWLPRLIASLAIVILAVAAVAFVAVRWVTRPLRTLSDAARQLGEDIGRPPLDEGGPAEVSQAARSFNIMQRRLSESINERARTFAAMSHDLKTPITRLRLRAALLDDDAARAKFESDLGEMEQMVSGALDLVRGIEQHEPPEAIDVCSMLQTVSDDAALTGGKVTVECNVSRPIMGKPQSLKRCFANLVENAVKYGSEAVVTVVDEAQGVEVRIVDRGPGIPETDLARVFEPFYRVEQSRSRETGGTGLGLTIARNIARAHGGTIVLRNRSEGGLEAVVKLPR